MSHHATPAFDGEGYDTKVADRPSRCQAIANTLLWVFSEQWFLLALGCLVLLSSQVQIPASGQHLKQTLVTYLCVSIIFFITGCTISTKALLSNYSRWKLHLFVQVQCFLMTSAIVFAVVSACAADQHFMEPWLLVGMIFMGCTPTTINSNVVMTRQAGGNTPLTVVQSTIGNFLGPFLTPVLVQMYTSADAWYTQVLPASSGDYGQIYRRVFKQLGLSLFLPMAIGQVVQYLFPKGTNKVFKDWKLSKISSICLLLIVWQSFDQAFESRAFESVKASNMIFIVFISIAFYALWLAICFFTSVFWLRKEDVVSICYCVPAKTPAMGIPLVISLYDGVSRRDQSFLQVPLIIFLGLQLMSGSLLTTVFRRWLGAEERKQHEQGSTSPASLP